MINQQLIERLKQKNWYVKCQNKQDARLVLQACDDAEITWAGGEKLTEWYPFKTYPFDIGFFKDGNGITQDYYNLYEKEEVENITDWFFNAIKNNDGNLIPKLTPQSAEQEHLVQILLAMMQKIPVEVNISGEWELSVILFPTMNYEYRIKPKPTPLPISREIWSHLDKIWKYATMDRDGLTFWHQEKPTQNHLGWGSVDYRSTYPLNFNSEGINWETSLTERPEGV